MDNCICNEIFSHVSNMLSTLTNQRLGDSNDLSKINILYKKYFDINSLRIFIIYIKYFTKCIYFLMIICMKYISNFI